MVEDVSGNGSLTGAHFPIVVASIGLHAWVLLLLPIPAVCGPVLLHLLHCNTISGKTAMVGVVSWSCRNPQRWGWAVQGCIPPKKISRCFMAASLDSSPQHQTLQCGAAIPGVLLCCSPDAAKQWRTACATVTVSKHASVIRFSSYVVELIDKAVLEAVWQK